MEVDLQRMKTEIERELRRLEQRRAELKKQISHIESVERIAATVKGRSDERVVAAFEPDKDREKVAKGTPSEDSKSWFRR